MNALPPLRRPTAVLAALTVMAASAAMLTGCGTLRPSGDDRPERISHTGDPQVDKLNQGYSLLHQNVAGLKLADKILLVKFESDSTEKVVTAISDYSAKLATQLEALPARYPSVRIDLQPLPEIEHRKQVAANK
ncbi:MAG: hypothetical protein M3Y32_01915, partial [Pseudomonadota bacterium]|nr:hypothetical protein [Pseudomonadota bacterium]